MEAERRVEAERGVEAATRAANLPDLEGSDLRELAEQHAEVRLVSEIGTPRQFAYFGPSPKPTKGAGKGMRAGFVTPGGDNGPSGGMRKPRARGSLDAEGAWFYHVGVVAAGFRGYPVTMTNFDRSHTKGIASLPLTNPCFPNYATHHDFFKLRDRDQNLRHLQTTLCARLILEKVRNLGYLLLGLIGRGLLLVSRSSQAVLAGRLASIISLARRDNRADFRWLCHHNSLLRAYDYTLQWPNIMRRHLFLRGLLMSWDIIAITPPSHDQESSPRSSSMGSHRRGGPSGTTSASGTAAAPGASARDVDAQAPLRLAALLHQPERAVWTADYRDDTAPSGEDIPSGPPPTTSSGPGTPGPRAAGTRCVRPTILSRGPLVLGMMLA